jgi:hypothetical protein
MCTVVEPLEYQRCEVLYSDHRCCTYHIHTHMHSNAYYLANPTYSCPQACAVRAALNTYTYMHTKAYYITKLTYSCPQACAVRAAPNTPSHDRAHIHQSQRTLSVTSIRNIGTRRPPVSTATLTHVQSCTTLFLFVFYIDSECSKPRHTVESPVNHTPAECQIST